MNKWQNPTRHILFPATTFGGLSLNGQLESNMANTVTEGYMALRTKEGETPKPEC